MQLGTVFNCTQKKVYEYLFRILVLFCCKSSSDYILFICYNIVIKLSTKSIKNNTLQIETCTFPHKMQVFVSKCIQLNLKIRWLDRMSNTEHSAELHEIC